MLTKDACIALLSRAYTDNVDMVEALKRGDGALVYAEEDAILIRMSVGYLYLFYAVSRAAADRAVAGIAEMPACVSHGEHAEAAVRDKFRHTGCNCCYQAVYEPRVRATGDEGFDIRVLDESYAETAAAHYSLYNNPDEMREILRKGDMLGAFVGNELAGFVGIHDDGSCGMLEVYPEHRRKGFGRALEAAILNLCLDRGWVPFGQVIVGNDASIALQHAAGVTLSPHTVSWTWGEWDDEDGDR